MNGERAVGTPRHLVAHRIYCPMLLEKRNGYVYCTNLLTHKLDRIEAESTIDKEFLLK